MKNIVILLLLLSVLFCTSCIVTFENPLSDSQTSSVNKNLLGKWKSVDEEKVVFELFNSNSETILKLFEENEKTEKIIFSVSEVQIGNFNYFSLKIIDDDNPNTFIIAKYEIKNDEMTVWLLSKEKISELIEKGKLQGKKKDYGEISVSNSSEELKKFLESGENNELFEIFGKFKKQ